VTAYGHIAVIAWRGRQLTPQIRRHGMTPPAKILRQYLARLQTRLLLGGQTILAPKSRRRVALMLFVPIACNLPVVLIELRMLLRRNGRSNEKCHHETNCMMCFHRKRTLLDPAERSALCAPSLRLGNLIEMRGEVLYRKLIEARHPPSSRA
jgi:hypothetical protein